MAPFLSVIIPAFNEEKRVKKTLVAVDSYLKNQNYEYEVVVVNDGSSDNTDEIIKNYSKLLPYLRLVDYQENRGKGFAVKEGMRLSKGQYKLFMDADNSTSISNVETFMPYLLKGGYDIAISSRQKPESTLLIPQPLYRRLLGKIFRFLVHSVIPLPVKDSQNGFKIFKKEAANFLFAKQTVDGWAFDVEILALAVKFQFKIKEVGIEWKNNKDSRLSLRGMIGMLSEIMKIRMNLWRNRYD